MRKARSGAADPRSRRPCAGRRRGAGAATLRRTWSFPQLSGSPVHLASVADAPVVAGVRDARAGGRPATFSDAAVASTLQAWI